MSSCSNILFGTSFLAFVLFSYNCIDPAKKFKNFDKRVLDAGKTAVGTGCKSGEIPDITGEFYLGLSTPLASDAHFKFIVDTKIDKSVNPAMLTMTMQPLCVQAKTCTIGEPIGEPFTLPTTPVDENCNFKVPVDGMPVTGAANPLSGADLIGNLEMEGNLQSPDFFCGIVNGDGVVGGAPIPVNNSTFGSIRITPGTQGDTLPKTVVLCPKEEEIVPDASTPDASTPDASTPDASTPDANTPDANTPDANTSDAQP